MLHGDLHKQVNKNLSGSMGPLGTLLDRRRRAFRERPDLRWVLLAIDVMIAIAGEFTGRYFSARWEGRALSLLGIVLNHFLIPAVLRRKKRGDEQAKGVSEPTS